MTVNELNICIVGTGYFSRFHAASWRRLAQDYPVNLVAVIDISLSEAEDFAREFSIPHALSSIDGLKNLDISLVDIVTPSHSHKELINSLSRHCDVMVCQKPFCRDLAEAREVSALMVSKGKLLIVHENFRFMPWFTAMKQILSDGQLGRVHNATFRLRPGDGLGPDAYLQRQPYFQKMKRFLVQETAVHFIDVFRYLFGECHDVFAKLSKMNPVIEGEDAGLLVFSMDNNVTAVLDANRCIDHAAVNTRLTMGEMIIEGESAVLSLNGFGELSVRNLHDKTVRFIDYEWHDTDFGGDCVYLTNQHIVRHLLFRETLSNDAPAYLTNLEIVEAIYQSNCTRSVVNIKQEPFK